jgi:BRCA1-associated protein
MLGYHLIISVNGAKHSPESRSEITFTPKHIFQRLPLHKPSLSCRRSSVGQVGDKDYRKGPLKIDWMDFEVKEGVGRRQSISTGKEKERGRGMHYKIPALETLMLFYRSSRGHVRPYFA